MKKILTIFAFALLLISCQQGVQGKNQVIENQSPTEDDYSFFKQALMSIKAEEARDVQNKDMYTLPPYSIGYQAEPSDNGVISAFAVKKGNLLEDPAGYKHEYALQLTRALDWYDKNGNEQKGAFHTYGADGGEKVIVAIIDSGINGDHTDFKRNGESILLYHAKSSKGGDISFNNKTYNSDTQSGHGTHCAGSICAVADNKVGISGAAGGVKKLQLIAYSVMPTGTATSKQIYSGLEHLAKVVTYLRKDPATRGIPSDLNLPPDIPPDFQITQATVPVSMSLGGSGLDPYQCEVLQKVFDAGILPIIALGNDSVYRTAYPASIYGSVMVSACTRHDRRADFTNANPLTTVTSPGFNIISCLNEGMNGVQFMSGTSMATPFVSGAVSYLLSFPEAQSLKPYEIKRLLEITSDRVDTEHPTYGNYDSDGFSAYYGAGRINVLRMIEYLKDPGKRAQAQGYYLNEPYTVKTSTSVRIYLYDTEKKIFLSNVGTTGKGTEYYFKFYGLVNGRKYEIITYDGNRHAFTAGKEWNYSF